MVYTQKAIMEHPFFTPLFKYFYLFLTLAFCLFLFETTERSFLKEKMRLEAILSYLDKEIEELKKQEEQMHLRIFSQDKQDYIEMMMIRHLGVIPKNSKKVVFKRSLKDDSVVDFMRN